LFLPHPMELLGDVGHVESHFGPFRNGVSVGVRLVYGLRQTYHRLGNHFGCTRWNSKVMWVMSNLVSVHLEMVLELVEDRCTVCAKHTIAQESFWTHPMVLLGDMGHVESCFGLFGDCVSVAAS
jgi:hypothetical protein